MGIGLALVGGALFAIIFVDTRLLIYVGLGLFALSFLARLCIYFLFVPPHYLASYKQYKKGNIEKALELITKSIQVRPKSSEAYALRSYYQMCLGKMKQAKEDADMSIQLNAQSSVGYRTLGQWHYFQGQYDKALEGFTEAVKLDPKDTANYCSIGQIYYYLQEYDKAVEYLEKALNLGRNECIFTSLYFLGRCFEELDREEEADAAFEKMVRYSGDFEKIKNACKHIPDEYQSMQRHKEDLEDMQDILDQYM